MINHNPLHFLKKLQTQEEQENPEYLGDYIPSYLTADNQDQDQREAAQIRSALEALRG